MSDHFATERELKELLSYCTAQGRICPQPIIWHQLWQLLKGRSRERRTTGYEIAQSVDEDRAAYRPQFEPPLPNILSLCWATSDVQKMEKLRKQLLWAAQHGVLDVAEAFLRGLAPDDWHRRAHPTTSSVDEGIEHERRARAVETRAAQAKNREARLCRAQAHRDRKPAIDQRYSASLDQDLIRAYRATNYVVFTDSPFALRIGEHSAPLAHHYNERGVSCATYITGWNPKGVAVTYDANETAQKRLRAEAEELGFECIEGEGGGEIGEWAPEASLLILGCSRSRAKRLGHKFKQNAVVWIGPNAVPELVVLMPLGNLPPMPAATEVEQDLIQLLAQKKVAILPQQAPNLDRHPNTAEVTDLGAGSASSD